MVRSKQWSKGLFVYTIIFSIFECYRTDRYEFRVGGRGTMETAE